MADQGTVIFEGREILVRGACEFPGRSLVITFTHRRTNPRPDRQGFGAGFFARRGIPAIHVIGLRNHWWQVPEMEDVLRAFRNLELRRFYDSITTYGSSMGGHGAMIFSGPLEADRVLAFSPQFALHGREAAWNAGWVEETRDLAELYRPEEHLSRTAAITVVADPLLRFDMQHLAAFRRLRGIDLLPVPFGLHPPMRYLRDQDLLSLLVQGQVQGGFDIAATRAVLRARRLGNLRYLLGLAQRLRRQRRQGHRLVVTLGLQEIERRLEAGEPIPNPTDAAALVSLAGRDDLLTDEGALRILGRLVELNPDQSSLLGEMAKLQLRCGRLAEATTAARRAVRLERRSVEARLNLAGILLLGGETQKATEAAQSAMGLNGRNPRPWKEFLASHKGRIDPGLDAEIRRRFEL